MNIDERPTINKEIGERIKTIRKQKGITLADLGARLGISESNMQRYESGKIASVSIDFINRLAPILEVKPEWLIGWDKEPTPQGYYIDSETAEYAEYLRTRPSARLLFSASRGISKEEMQEAVNYIEFIKSRNKK
ncbi:helix-turn-helix domain-containing protein [Veillonella parvula]|jgi:transcriptional regulator with XRE-family HTH domain|uniref:helix-turn-helix domain-containing protein n=1 Tax=Veillonella parvula TaxID=29466 RepID=UPI0020703681|nr:helix-turn-helix transcriptional regulator [Veillonella parvula]DAO71159.1 MAG TPA: helix-turn-helix domain protein [Caudoviricetes sp.]